MHLYSVKGQEHVVQEGALCNALHQTGQQGRDCWDIGRAWVSLQASSSWEARRDAAAQVAVWENQGLETGIDPDLLVIYRLLGGDPHPLIRLLDLDWRRAFGLQLW